MCGSKDSLLLMTVHKYLYFLSAPLLGSQAVSAPLSVNVENSRVISVTLEIMWKETEIICDVNTCQ